MTGKCVDVVLVGAGHSHVEVLRSFAGAAPAGIRITLITRARYTPYSGMLPGLVSGLYRFEDAHIDTRPLARAADAAWRVAEAIALDLSGRRVVCRQGPAVSYDVLSLDIGSTPNTAGVPGAAEHALPVKPIDGFLSRLDALSRRLLDEGGAKRIAVVGAGAAGVELVLSVQRRLASEAVKAGLDPRTLKFTLVSGSADILPSFPPSFRRRFHRILRERDIEVVPGALVTGVVDGELAIHGRPALRADEILWATEASAPEWLRSSGLPLDGAGFVEVNADLRVAGQKCVFAAGDVAAFTPRNLPKSGVYAVREGPVLSDNIRRLLAGKTLRSFAPQREALCLVSTGERYAVGTRNGFVMEGRWVWRVKDWLDRRWIARYKYRRSAATNASRVEPGRPSRRSPIRSMDVYDQDAEPRG